MASDAEYRARRQQAEREERLRQEHTQGLSMRMVEVANRFPNGAKHVTASEHAGWRILGEQAAASALGGVLGGLLFKHRLHRLGFPLTAAAVFVCTLPRASDLAEKREASALKWLLQQEGDLGRDIAALRREFPAAKQWPEHR